MASRFWHAARLIIIPCLLHSSFPAAAQAQLGSLQRQNSLSHVAEIEGFLSEPLVQSTPAAQASRLVTLNATVREKVARHLASKYLALWSEPKQVTLASASVLYASTVMFHGRKRTLASVVAEKQRFARRWPHRRYGHRPETTQVTCSAGDRCTVRASFDFAATNARGERRSRGVGEHELVLRFTDGRAKIVAEDSRVIIRGHGNMTQSLDDRP